MDKIKIITDSASDITKNYEEEYNISVLPFSILFPDGSEYLERVNITYDEFYEKIKQFSEPPKTAQVNSSAFLDEIKKCASDYDSIIIVTISSAGSATHQNALIAKRQAEEEGIKTRIEVFDSMTYTGGYGTIVKELGRMAKEGITTDELCKNAQFMIENNTVHAIIDDLKYLKISGRIKPLSFTLGSLLDIKPVIIVEDGLVVQKEKVRGVKKAANKILELNMQITSDGDGYLLYLGNTTDNGTYESLKERLVKQFYKAELVESRIGATIGSHCGPGVICTGLIKKC